MVNSGKLGAAIKPKSLVTSSTGVFKKRQEKPFDVIIVIVILHTNTWRCAEPFACIICFNAHSTSEGRHPGF